MIHHHLSQQSLLLLPSIKACPCSAASLQGQVGRCGDGQRLVAGLRLPWAQVWGQLMCLQQPRSWLLGELCARDLYLEELS